ncbi:MAG: hypothetical protein JXO51_08375 [Candidatus Aminicenantes bacterium]|nr:hypothetical protein [Candidatus Aminicenantes bacterium]
MNSKKLGLAVLLIVILTASAFAVGSRRPVRRGPTSYAKGDMLVSPELVLVYSTTSLGADLEYFINGNISVGGDLLLFLEGNGGMIISPDVAFHFDVKVENLDVFAGAGPALAFAFSGGGSEFGFKPFGGARYFFTPKLAAYFKLLAFIGSGSSFGGAFGVSFQL